MAETKDQINHVAPRDVQPDSVTGAGHTHSSDKDKSSGRTLRPDPVVENAGEDRAGVAGGGIDSNVSGLGSDRNAR